MCTHSRIIMNRVTVDMAHGKHWNCVTIPWNALLPTRNETLLKFNGVFDWGGSNNFSLSRSPFLPFVNDFRATNAFPCPQFTLWPFLLLVCFFLFVSQFVIFSVSFVIIHKSNCIRCTYLKFKWRWICSFFSICSMGYCATSYGAEISFGNKLSSNSWPANAADGDSLPVYE